MKYNRLSRPEELRLWELHQQGDKAAREALILSVVPYAFKLAMRWKGDLDDLAQIANTAVIQCVDSGFDPHKGRLTTFVTRRIYWALHRESHMNKQGIRIPPAARKGSLNHISSKLANIGMLSLLDDADVAAKESSDFDDETIALLKERIAELPIRDKTILEAKINGKTYKEIGLSLGVTKQRVAQVYHRTIKELRKKTW